MLAVEHMDNAGSVNFVNNLKKLMKIHGISQNEIAKRTKVAQKTINNLVNQIQCPNVETVEKIAQCFNLEGWQMIMPISEDDLIRPQQFQRIINSYRLASEEGKKHIEMVAEREAEYNSHADGK